MFILITGIVLLVASVLLFFYWLTEQRKRYLITVQKRLAGNASHEEEMWWRKVKRHRFVNAKEFFKYTYLAKKRKVYLVFRAMKHVIIAAYNEIKPKKKQKMPPPMVPVDLGLLDDKPKAYYANDKFVNIGVQLRQDMTCDGDDEGPCNPFENRQKTEAEILEDNEMTRLNAKSEDK